MKKILFISCILISSMVFGIELHKNKEIKNNSNEAPCFSHSAINLAVPVSSEHTGDSCHGDENNLKEKPKNTNADKSIEQKNVMYYIP